MTTHTRASLDELRDFANKVREAGGGNPVDALMPSVPSDSTKCLIARNLNFNCSVNKPDSDGPWHMWIDDGEIAEKVSVAIGNEEPPEYQPGGAYTDPAWGVPLPEHIGQVAADFDAAWAMVLVLADAHHNWNNYLNADEKGEYDGFLDYVEQEFLEDIIMDWGREHIDQELIKEMWPYIEESVKEVREIGIFDEKGNLVL